MRRLDRIGRPEATVERYSIDQLALDVAQFGWAGNSYATTGLNTTWGNQTAEQIPTSYEGYVQAGYKSNGVIFACILARLLLFSEVRFQYQRLAGGRPGDLFGTPALSLLERPWPGGTTGDLLARMEQHASLAGNSYTLNRGDRLKQLRPDWVSIVVGSRSDDPTVMPDPHSVDADLLGYIYHPGGVGSSAKPVTFLPNQIAHYAPVPDPIAQYRGMSWLTPVVQEIRADKQATDHKLKFFENAATPNMVVTYPKEITAEQLGEYMKLIQQDHAGTINAYKTLHLGGGADPTVVGADLKQLDFKTTQGAGETRIAAAAGVPPIVVGLSEGLEASTYSNYGQARRKFADGWARPAWRQAAGALSQIIDVPSDARLWYDASDVSFLQEDERDAAEIMAQQAMTIRQLTDAGYTPDSVKAAVQGGDLALLQHSGLFSVQLQTPGTGQPTSAT